MVLPILKYGHPTLRQKGARIETIKPEIRQLVADMLETMQAAHGVGLAAQQVGHALQLAVVDLREVKDRPSTLEIAGQPVEPATRMPLVLINPRWTPAGPDFTGGEGCLSFPEIYGEITRPGQVDVTATNEHGEPLAFRCGGLLAKAIQHEYDHLQGILFIDRMTREVKDELRAELEELQAATKAALKKKK